MNGIGILDIYDLHISRSQIRRMSSSGTAIKLGCIPQGGIYTTKCWVMEQRIKMVVASSLEAGFPYNFFFFYLDDFGVENPNLGCSVEMTILGAKLVLIVQRVLGRGGPPFYPLLIYSLNMGWGGKNASLGIGLAGSCLRRCMAKLVIQQGSQAS